MTPITSKNDYNTYIKQAFAYKLVPFFIIMIVGFSVASILIGLVIDKPYNPYSFDNLIELLVKGSIFSLIILSVQFQQLNIRWQLDYSAIPFLNEEADRYTHTLPAAVLNLKRRQRVGMLFVSKDKFLLVDQKGNTLIDVKAKQDETLTYTKAVYPTSNLDAYLLKNQTQSLVIMYKDQAYWFATPDVDLVLELMK